MAVLVTAIHAFLAKTQVVDGRNKSGHDGRGSSPAMTRGGIAIYRTSQRFESSSVAGLRLIQLAAAK